ncbi:phosphopantothenate--cysteine ligase [Neocloeon triangulifer]|uniref:phosphopantothenate--cysteine ligase n=1 Tax=Neocloeon triangulifer TaxID=2078957 RepID=UPI00286FA8E1|nr:phosphopantothenate--cysteine ligase [Neocloeon triangulifer]
MNPITWEEFYLRNAAPSDLESRKKEIQSFCQKFEPSDLRVVLITSGGTTVPLEHNTVRFVDNFSAGTRGSASAEYFLKAGYAVIFMHRYKSLEPFSRHFSGNELLDSIQVLKDDSLQVDPAKAPVLLPILKDRKEALDSGRLLMVNFTTLTEYLWILRASAEAMACLNSRAMLYLAAAVSDFYVPPEKMPEHKIQSTGGPPEISLQLVPKMLRPLVADWVPKAFVISFKLETDPSLLVSKSQEALKNYRHKVVIANELHSRKSRVTLVTPNSHHEIVLSKEELDAGVEIEERIINDLVEQHTSAMTTLN